MWKGQLMFVDPKSREQQMTRSTSIADMETSGCSHSPDSLVDVGAAESERCVASKT